MMNDISKECSDYLVTKKPRGQHCQENSEQEWYMYSEATEGLKKYNYESTELEKEEMR